MGFGGRARNWLRQRSGSPESAQSQTTLDEVTVTAQSPAAGGAIVWVDANDATAGVYAYGSYQGVTPQYMVGLPSPDAVWSYNIGAAMNGVGNISMYRVLGQFAAITVGGAGGWAIKGGYAGIGAVAGAVGGGKATNGSPSGILFGAAIGSLTGGAAAWAGDAAGVSGLGGAAFSSLAGGTAGLASTVAMNVWTGNPLMENAVYGTAIGALGPLASGEAMAIGGAGLPADSAIGYILNTGTNAVTVGLGP